MWENVFKKSSWKKKKERKADKIAFTAIMMQVLRAGCAQPKWFSIDEIHLNCSAWTHRKCNVNVTRDVLRDLGFTQRKRRSNRLYVYINLEKPQEKAPEEIKRPRLLPRDTIQNFARACIETRRGNIILKVEVYAALIDYCRKIHLPVPCRKNSLTIQLPKYISNLKSGRKIINGKRVGFWRDIALRPPD